MEIKTNTCIPPAPGTTRGQPLHFGVYKKQGAMVYGNGLFTYSRKMDGSGEVMAVHKNKVAVTAVRVSPNECYCASGDKQGNVVIWALDNVQHTTKNEAMVVNGAVMDMCFTGDTQRIVVVGEGRDSFTNAYMVDGGSSVGEIKGHTKTVLSCDMRAERPFCCATGSEDMEVGFHQGVPFKWKATYKNHTNTVNTVRYSPDGDRFVTVGSDKQMFIHDGKTGEKVSQIACDHTGSVYSVAWDASGKKLFTASADKSCKLWDVESGKCLQTFKVQDKTVDYMQMGCAYVGDQMVSVSLNGDTNVFAEGKAEPATVLRGHMKPVTAIAVEGQTVVTCSGDPSILIWGQQTHKPEMSRRPGAKKMHGSVISGCVIKGNTIFTCAMDDSIGVTALDSAEMKLLTGKVSGGPNGMVYMDGHLVITTNKGIYMVDEEGNEKCKVATSYTPTCCASNGKILAVGAKEKKFVLYNVAGGKITQVEEVTDQHKAALTAVAFSKCGTKLATADSGREILLWTYDGALKMTSGPGAMPFHNAGIKAIAFSPNGCHLATGSVDTHVIVWDLANNTRVKHDGAHLGGVNTVAWLSDVEIITAGHDSAIRTWALKL